MSPSDVDSARSRQERVLIFVRGSRDAELTRDLLVRSGVDATVCADMAALCAGLEEGAAAALLEEEVLNPSSLEALTTALGRQPPWSDFPVLVFGAISATTNRSTDGLATRLGNVTFLERPVRTRSMLAAVRAAIRSRLRQYEGRRAIESRDTFLAMLGHELRNPLGAICFAIAMMEKKYPDRARPREHDIIDRQAKHLTRLVDDLLDVARVTQGKIALRTERVNLADAARSAFEAQEAHAHDRGLSYDFDASAGPIWVTGDRQRLEQVLANLLTNAIKYTPRGGAIRMVVRPEGDEAVVTVTDTGVGIAPDMLSRIFDVFAQANRTLDRTEGGIGLGLTLVRSLVQLHRGTVEGASAGPGCGSSFVVRLPAVNGNAAEARTSSIASEDRSTAKRIVIVEDSADIRDLFIELLRQDGHDVSSADDGPGGLDEILTVEPDVAFVDLGLPGFDGLELARRLRASGSSTWLVAVTGYGQHGDRAHAFEAGFDDHLTKPVTDVDLRRVMLRLAGKRPGATAG